MKALFFTGVLILIVFNALEGDYICFQNELIYSEPEIPTGIPFQGIPESIEYEYNPAVYHGQDGLFLNRYLKNSHPLSIRFNKAYYNNLISEVPTPPPEG